MVLTITSGTILQLDTDQHSQGHCAVDPLHFGTDPDPRIRTTDLQIRIRIRIRLRILLRIQISIPRASVLQIREILVRFRIRGSVPLTYRSVSGFGSGSGSCSGSGSAFLRPVLWICDILVRIRIFRSVLLAQGSVYTSGYGSANRILFFSVLKGWIFSVEG